MCKLDELRKQRDAIYEIARKHKVKKLYVFGSCARREETPQSDVDFLAEFQPETSFFELIRLHDELEAFLGNAVDVVSKNGIHPFLKKNILTEALEL